METSLSREELFEYIKMQTETFFPDKYKLEGNDVHRAFEIGLERLEYCFQHITFLSYCDQQGQTFFNHMHSDQYAQFLYFFSNSLWNDSENRAVCDKLIFLNRMLNGFFISYKGKMPDVFFLGHPVGSIIGNAVYDDFLVVFQNVTINTDADEDGNPAPKIGRGVFLGAGAKIIGNKPVGNYVSIGVDAVVHNREIPDDKVVIKDEEGRVLITDRKKEKCFAQNYFNVDVRKPLKD